MKLPNIPLDTTNTKDIGLQDFIAYCQAILNDGRYQLRILTEVPTYDTNNGEMVAVIQGTVRSLYMYINDGWYRLSWQSGTQDTGVPTGSILPFGGQVAAVPDGFILCNGAAASRTTYDLLFAVIGTDYGVGDGSTTFNVPDGRAKFLYGVYDGGTPATAGVTGGASTNTASGTTGGPSGYTGATPGANSLTTVHTHAFTSSAFSIMPPYLAVNYIIKY